MINFPRAGSQPFMGGEAHAGMAIGAENILAKVDAALQLSCDLVDSFIYAGAPIQDLGFGTWLENLLQWQNLGLLDKIGTFLGPFWDLSGTFCRYFDDTTAKQYRRLKRHIVATFSAKSGLFENHFRTFTGNLDYILINIWRKCLIKYLMQVDIPDHLKPNVFLIRASGRPTGGLYTCNSLIY